MKGWTANVPIPGVDISHSNFVGLMEFTLMIATPLVLLVANISTDSSGKPVGATSMSTEEIEDAVTFDLINPELIIFLFTESTITNVGAEEYPSPLLVIKTWSRVLKSSNTIVGDTFALGLNVLSEEYVNLLFSIFFSFTVPTVFDIGFTIKSDPLVEFVDFKIGRDLYPNPKDNAFKEFTGPDAEFDVVE